MNKAERFELWGFLKGSSRIPRASITRLLRLPVAVGIVALGTVAWAPTALAAGGRLDYDLDNDRLIEINDLQDLNQIRSNLSGHGSFYNVVPANLGCPGGCLGFELTTNLNFDTNGNDVIDEGDPSYNDGEGFVPIGADSVGVILGAFTGLFNGNGYKISNLMCSNRDNCGLFAQVASTTISNLRVINVSVIRPRNATGAIAAMMANSTLKGCSSSGKIWGTNASGSGGLVGDMTSSTIDESYSTTVVAGGDQNGGLVGIAKGSSVIKRSFAVGRTSSWRYHNYSGGIAGTLDGSSIDNCFATGNIGESPYAGGLVGLANGGSVITRSFATGRHIGADGPRGGLVGVGTHTVNASYWAVDLTGQASSAGGGVGATVAQLKCPTTSLDPACPPGMMYPTWNTQLNSANAALWNQGTNQQLPGLNIQGATFRDADGDGVLDSQDYYPQAYAASANSDGDGSIDRWKEGCEVACRGASGLVLDQFPTNAAATLDLDLDRRPEAWNPTCNAACQASSGLTLDTKPGDQDNDGISDADDINDDANAVADADRNSNGLVDIQNVGELYAMRYQTRGYGQRKIPWTMDEYGVEDDSSDTSGCPPRILDGVLTRKCRGYELLNDINFDTNNNGSSDPGDTYYNGGEGWEPIGHIADQTLLAFQTLLEGNGYRILNLYINRPAHGQAGLFGATRDATIQNLGLTGPLMHLTLGSEAGALVGSAQRTTVREVYSTGTIISEGTGQAGGLIGTLYGGHIIGSFATGEVEVVYPCDTVCGAGGLVGTALGGRITASFATGAVHGEWGEMGGLVGVVLADDWTGALTTIEGSYSTGLVDGNPPVGGLVGSMPNTTIASHWAINNSQQPTSAGSPVGATLAQLACSTSANDTACAPTTLFAGWDNYVDEDSQPYWYFGSDTELPGLCYEGTLYRDAQGDGILDLVSSCTPPTPCTGICNSPANISWAGTYSGVNLGTGELCLQTNQVIAGGNCGNFAAGRTLTVNGQSRPCNGANWSSVPAPVNGGYCIRATAGDWASAFITLW